MLTLVIDRRGFSLDYEGQCLIVRHPQLPTRSLPMTQLHKIICLHGVAMHTRVIGQCQRHGVDFIVLNSRCSEHSFAVHAAHQRQAARRLHQYRLSADDALALHVARRLMQLKLANCLRELRHAGDMSRYSVVSGQVQQLAACMQADALRGHEGVAQRAMFQHWRAQLPAALGFVSRQRRPPPDPVNAVLSLTYTLAHHEAVRQCLVHGLDPWLGFHHRLAPGRYSLACDLIEPLRPRIERWVVAQFCQQHLERRHFSNVAGQCLLGKAGREIYYPLWYQVQPLWSRLLRRYAAVLARGIDAWAGQQVQAA